MVELITCGTSWSDASNLKERNDGYRWPGSKPPSPYKRNYVCANSEATRELSRFFAYNSTLVKNVETDRHTPGNY